jgi:hypothetical protein
MMDEFVAIELTAIHCPFCGWHRMRDTAKTNAVVWDYVIASRQLLAHIEDTHHEAWADLLLTWRNML